MDKAFVSSGDLPHNSWYTPSRGRGAGTLFGACCATVYDKCCGDEGVAGYSSTAAGSVLKPQQFENIYEEEKETKSV